MAYYFPEIPQSSYALNYKYTPPRPMQPKYHAVPCIVDQPVIVEPPRSFPIEPVGPSRVNPLDQAPASGLGCKGVPSQRIFDPYKDVSRDAGELRRSTIQEIPPPNITGLPVIRGGTFQLPIQSNLNRDIANQIYQERVFASTATRSMKECAIPMRQVHVPTTTRELRPDMVRLLPQKYEPSVGVWQHVPLWDKIQTRRLLHKDEPNPALERVRQIKENKKENMELLEKTITSSVRDLIAQDRLASSYSLQHCGYLGYKPRSTGEPLCRNEQRPLMTSVSHATHGKIPSREYHQMCYGRHAPMSKQLTLTYPYNPFNKIEEDTEFSAYSE